MNINGPHLVLTFPQLIEKCVLSHFNGYNKERLRCYCANNPWTSFILHIPRTSFMEAVYREIRPVYARLLSFTAVSHRVSPYYLAQYYDHLQP